MNFGWSAAGRSWAFAGVSSRAAVAASWILVVSATDASFLDASEICFLRVRMARLIWSMSFSSAVFSSAAGAPPAGGASWARRMGWANRNAAGSREARTRNFMAMWVLTGGCEGDSTRRRGESCVEFLQPAEVEAPVDVEHRPGRKGKAVLG